jgi:hypothetical protein
VTGVLHTNGWVHTLEHDEAWPIVTPLTEPINTFFAATLI